MGDSVKTYDNIFDTILDSFSIPIESLVEATSVKRHQAVKKLRKKKLENKNLSKSSLFEKGARTTSSILFQQLEQSEQPTSKPQALTDIDKEDQMVEETHLTSSMTATLTKKPTTTKTTHNTTTPPAIQNSRESIDEHCINAACLKFSFNYYSLRMLILFLLGSLTSFIIDHLLTQNHITQYPKDIVKLVNTAAWIPPTCGFSAVLVGSMFPLADYWFQKKPQEFQREWSNVMRCLGGFIGVAYAATKLPWNSSSQVSLTLALISVVLWFLFDRTFHGFVMSVLFSSIGTGVMYVLVSCGIY
ncbi:8553_t:CDS:2, partial [Ambispora leptoticha]